MSWTNLERGEPFSTKSVQPQFPKAPAVCHQSPAPPASQVELARHRVGSTTKAVLSFFFVFCAEVRSAVWKGCCFPVPPIATPPWVCSWSFIITWDFLMWYGHRMQVIHCIWCHFNIRGNYSKGSLKFVLVILYLIVSAWYYNLISM